MEHPNSEILDVLPPLTTYDDDLYMVYCTIPTILEIVYCYYFRSSFGDAGNESRSHMHEHVIDADAGVIL